MSLKESLRVGTAGLFFPQFSHLLAESRFHDLNLLLLRGKLDKPSIKMQCLLAFFGSTWRPVAFEKTPAS